ncbi:thiamine pyrophosphate-binding protein [Varibaculum cambriense]|uniref:thiamine pyrophosphate-binding protein n=1 Tax=Varibaculum cambriense TaxID=184870 RepID=UPI0029094926|nr:thiamine pyrophosphate-binding protein [Varibaculum cambriense]MDU5542564.1 thiamine pyrophosphate-binding protein [Varibaculum cambriense]
MSDVSFPSTPSRSSQNNQSPNLAGGHLESATSLARLVVSELVRAGVRDFVICPGSRSAPLTYALAALEQAGVVRTHVRLDERSAAFFALGLAKSGIYKGEDASYNPVALVVTSGTAVAELHAGLLEAFHCGVPLIALSADRPRTARGTGANQTTWQEGIFGAACPVALDIDSSEDALQVVKDRLRAALAQTGGQGKNRAALRCPLHINLCFAPPLVTSNTWQIPPELLALTLDQNESATSSPRSFKTQIVADGGGEPPRKNAKTVVVLADQCHSQVAQAAQEWGLPVLAEPTVTLKGGNVVQIAHAPQVLPAFANEIEQVILSGHATLSRPVNALLSREDIPIYRLPSLGAASNLTGKYVSTTTAQVDSVFPAAASPAWLARWCQAAQAVERAYRTGVDRRAVTVWQNANYASYDPQELSPAEKDIQASPSRRISNHGFTTSGEARQDESEAAHRLRISSPESAPELAGSLRELGMGIDPYAFARIYEDVYEAWVTRDPDSARDSGAKAKKVLNSADNVRYSGTAVSGESAAAQLDDKKMTAAGAPPLTMLGASNTIRAFDLAARGDRGITYCANRGLAGIDGNIATALGLAAGTGQAVRLIAGDLTCLHDLTGLLTGSLEATPVLQLLVLSDGGGRIFATLEHGEQENQEVFKRYFLTPQDFDLSALAAGLGWDYRCAKDIEELKRILGENPRREIVEINAYLPDLRARRVALESEIRRELAAL